MRASAPWIGPLRLPRRVSVATWRFSGLADRLYAGWLWLPAAALAGTVPLAMALVTGGAWHQFASALLLFAVFLAAVRGDHVVKGIGAIGAAYGAHMALAIFASSVWPDHAAACFPGGEAYWQKNLVWLQSGVDPEYELANWVPAHFQLFGAMALFGYLSLGLIPFVQGFREVDLMNYYVGRLVSNSSSDSVAISLGWHTWSVMRGICYALLIYEVASWSLQRLSGETLSTRRARIARWSTAVGFFALDCLLKLTMLEPVRQQLQENLAQGL